MWTSFLKARLVCGIPKESLYFNRLQDVYVMHADNWQDTRVYALFTSNWLDASFLISKQDANMTVTPQSTVCPHFQGSCPSSTPMS